MTENQNKNKEVVEEKQPDAEKLAQDSTLSPDNNSEHDGEPIKDPDMLEDEAMKAAEEDTKDQIDALEQTDDAAENKFGEDVKKNNFNYYHAGGVDKNIVSASNLRGVRVNNSIDEYSFTDIDPEEKNAARIQHAINHIAAEVVKEGTPGCKEDYFNERQESNVAIERESMDSVQRVVGETGAAKPSAAGGSTQNGDIFESTNGFLDLTDHMYHTTLLERSQYSIKNMEHLNGVVLNEFTPDGQLDKYHYRFIRQRHCLVVAINPMPIAGVIDEKFMTLRKLDDRVDRANNITPILRTKLLSSESELFKVIDLTATYEAVTSTCRDLLPNVTSLEERASLGEIEAIANAMQREELPIAADTVIPEDVELHPSYRRCSLYSIDPAAFAGGYNVGCENKIESVAKLLKFMGESEAVWLKLRAPWGQDKDTIWKGYKFRKHFAGKDNSMDYFNSGIKGNIRADLADYQTVPGINTFGAFINTNPHGRIDMLGNFLYRHKDLQRKIENYINAYGKCEKLSKILATVTTNMQSIEHAIDVLMTGKLDTNTNLDHLGKLSGTVGMLLNFNPNDFISYTPMTRKVRFGTRAQYTMLKPYVAVGYVNSYRVDTTKINALAEKNYLLAPSWIAAICSIYDDDNMNVLNKLYNSRIDQSNNNILVKSFVELLTANGSMGLAPGDAQLVGEPAQMDPGLPSGGGAGSLADSISYLDVNAKQRALFYQPFYINTDHPEWIDFFLNEMLWNAGLNLYLDGNLDYLDGYMHLYNIFTTKSVCNNSWGKYITSGGIPVIQAIEKIVSNPQCYCNDTAKKLSDLPLVIKSAQNLLKANHFDHQIAIFTGLEGTYSISLPDSRDFDLDDLGDFEIADDLLPVELQGLYNNDQITDKVHVILNSRCNSEGEYATDNPFVLAPIGENEFIVCPKDTNNNGYKLDPLFVMPLLLRKRNISEEESKYTKKRHIIINDGADKLDHIGESMDDAIYGYDDHYYNEDCYAYCIKINMHYSPTAGIANNNDISVLKQNNLAPIDWTMSVCPVEKFKTVFYSDVDYNSPYAVRKNGRDIYTYDPAGEDNWKGGDLGHYKPVDGDNVNDCPCWGYSNGIKVYKHELLGPYTIPMYGEVHHALGAELNFGDEPQYTEIQLSCCITRGAYTLSLYDGRRYDVSNLMNYVATPYGWVYFYSHPDMNNQDIVGSIRDTDGVIDAIDQALGWTFNSLTYTQLVYSQAIEDPTDLNSIAEEHVTTYASHVFEDSYRGKKFIGFEMFIPYSAYKIDTKSVLGDYAAANYDYNYLSDESLLRFTDVSDIDINRPEYWDRKFYRTTGYNGRIIFGMSDNQASDPAITDPALELAACNLPLMPEYFLDIDSGKFKSVTGLDMDNDFDINNAIESEWGGKNLRHLNVIIPDPCGVVVSNWKTPGNHIKTECIPSLYEAFDQFANGEYCLPLPARWFFSAAPFMGRQDDYMNVGFMATMPNNMTLNPVLFSRYYRRDHCDYIQWKSLVTMNRKWFDHYNINTKLSDTYRIDKKLGE